MPVLSHDRLIRELRDGARGGVYLLVGDEEHLRESAAARVAAAHLDEGTRDFNLDEVRGGEVTPETLASLIQTPPMMAEHRVVVVRDAQQLAANAASRRVLEDVVASPPPGLALVLSGDIGGSKAKLWKTLRQRAVTVDFPRLSDADLPGWLMATAERGGLRLDPDAARALAAAAGPGLAALLRELEKLREFVGERARATRSDIERLVGPIPRQDRWEWFDTVAEGRFEEARAGLPVLLQSGDSGVGLVIGLTNQFLRIAVFVTGGRGALESALPGNQKWLARRVEAQARRWDAESAARVLDDLRRADRLLKSAPLSDAQVMEELLLRMQHQHRAAA